MTDWTPVSPVNPTIYDEPNRPGSAYNPPVVVQIPGPQGVPGPQGEVGPQGLKGDTGDPGIHIGTTPPADTTIAWVNTS